MIQPPRPYRVDAVLPELEHTATLVLHPTQQAIDTLRPGQFAMLSAFGNAEVPISVSRIIGTELHHTIRAVGKGSSALASARRGDIVGVRGPFGTAWPLESARGRDLLVLAGGLGLAPLRPVIDHAIEHRASFGRVTVMYGTREPAAILYPQEHASWRNALDLLVTVDHADRAAGPPWRGHVGVITKLIRRATFDPPNTVAFVCGPEVMMRFSARDLEDAGVPAEHIFLSLERNMKCAIGLCGHCQYGPHFVCRDGPVLSHDRVEALLTIREL